MTKEVRREGRFYRLGTLRPAYFGSIKPDNPSSSRITVLEANTWFWAKPSTIENWTREGTSQKLHEGALHEHSAGKGALQSLMVKREL